MNFRTRRLTPFTAILMLVLCLALTPAFAAAAKKKKTDASGTSAPSGTTQSAATTSSDQSKSTRAKKTKQLRPRLVYKNPA